jgi:hypothetical protein
MRFTARSTKPKSGVVAPLQRLLDLWRTHNGPEGFDCLIIGKVFRWGQIRTQDALSVPQSPFDQETVLHGSRMSAMSSFRFNLTECHRFWLWRAPRRPAMLRLRHSAKSPFGGDPSSGTVHLALSSLPWPSCRYVQTPAVRNPNSKARTG